MRIPMTMHTCRYGHGLAHVHDLAHRHVTPHTRRACIPPPPRPDSQGMFPHVPIYVTLPVPELAGQLTHIEMIEHIGIEVDDRGIVTECEEDAAAGKVWTNQWLYSLSSLAAPHCSPLLATARHCSPLLPTAPHCSPLLPTAQPLHPVAKYVSHRTRSYLITRDCISSQVFVGDRIVSVNGIPLRGRSLSRVVELVLSAQVVSSEQQGVGSR
jgi:hypothetical protein